jgi:hypothetical protein
LRDFKVRAALAWGGGPPQRTGGAWAAFDVGERRDCGRTGGPEVPKIGFDGARPARRFGAGQGYALPSGSGVV